MVTSIAHGLHLSVGERDHLFRLAGHQQSVGGTSDDHIGPDLLRILDRLQDTPVEIVSELGGTLAQSPVGVALTGDASRSVGPARSIGFRWFTDPQSRRLYAPQDHDLLSRLRVSGPREVLARRGRPSRAADVTDLLLDRSGPTGRASGRRVAELVGLDFH